jgi:hypothetical protein
MDLITRADLVTVHPATTVALPNGQSARAQHVVLPSARPGRYRLQVRYLAQGIEGAEELQAVSEPVAVEIVGGDAAMWSCRAEQLAAAANHEWVTVSPAGLLETKDGFWLVTSTYRHRVVDHEQRRVRRHLVHRRRRTNHREQQPEPACLLPRPALLPLADAAVARGALARRRGARDDATAVRDLSRGRPFSPRVSGVRLRHRAADADMESYDAKLRRAQAIDVSVRFGFDEFPGRTTESPYFAVLSVGLNLGILFQSPANARAARARKQLVESGRGIGLEGQVDRLHETIEIESKRAKETEALVKELERQLDALNRIGGEESKRYRQTVWFEWVKAKAQHAYLETHVETIQQVLGGTAQ